MELEPRPAHLFIHSDRHAIDMALVRRVERTQGLVIHWRDGSSEPIGEDEGAADLWAAVCRFADMATIDAEIDRAIEDRDDEITSLRVQLQMAGMKPIGGRLIRRGGQGEESAAPMPADPPSAEGE